MHKLGLSVFFTVFLLCCNNSFGLEYNKFRYNQNTDFLTHEAGANQNAPKIDNVVRQTNNSPLPTSSTAKIDFPPLRSPSVTQTPVHPQNNQHSTRTTQSAGRRDYVAPNYPPLQPPTNSQNREGKIPTSVQASNTQSNGKRDYVAPNYPPLRPPVNSQQGVTDSQRNPVTQTSGKRDYVNTNIPNNAANNQQGKVKDLINFYDSRNPIPSNTPKTPSYSSILQGSKNMQGSVANTPNQTPKPFSVNSVASGSTHTSTVTTAKPSLTRPVTIPSKPLNPQTTRPFVLPSSIVNGNRNQGSNGNVISDTELQTLSEELLRKDTNNAAKYITINYQSKTTSQSKEDKAPLPLLAVSPEVWTIPTIQKFLPLLDNYERDTLVNEHVTPQERTEENAFMDIIMSTTVIRHLMNYLKEKGYVTPDPKQQRDYLKQLWFSLYSRGRGKISSSGFEHSFVSELKNGEVSGLHNWIYLSKEEQANRLNYLGYLKYEELNGKGAVIKLHFNHQGVDKPVDSIFVGTSPELEISLYTLCFLTRADDDCNLKLGGKDINIKTYTFRYRSKNLIGSAFPQI